MAKKTTPAVERIGTPSFLSGNNPADKLSKVLFVGAITDVIQYTNFYEISIDNAPAIYGTPVNHGSLGLIGVRDHVMYPPGTKVLCYMPVGHSICFIIGCVPDFDTNLNFNQSDWISQYSGVGLLDDSAHSAALDIGIPPYLFSNSRPYDAFPGEWGVSNPLGLLLHVGLSSFQIRAGDLAGISGFLFDRKLRISGHNLQVWSALKERFEGNDQGENVGYTISSPYPWEMLGARRAYVSSTTASSNFNYSTDAQGVDSNWKFQAEAGGVSQAESDQVAIPRISDLEGTLGYGRNSIVAIPPAVQPDVEKRANLTNYLGVSQVRTALDGTIEIRSARQVVIEKSCFIPVPKQIKDFSDPNGNSSDNGSANFAGAYGETTADFSMPEYANSEDGALTLVDRLSLEHNRVFDYFLRGKPLDWHMPTQAQLASSNVNTGYVFDPEVGKSFALSARAPLPRSVTMPVDHITGNTKDYYASKSGVYLLETGGVLIEDGWGSQLLLERGNIKLTCAGDFFFAGGRNFNVLAPNDVHIRGGGHTDISAGKGDVRIKAEKNMLLLAGNSGNGALVLEGRGEGTLQSFTGVVGSDVSGAGVIIKSPSGAVNVYGKSVYLRSTDSGTVTIDADQGLGQVVTYASSILELVNTGRTTVFGSTPAKPGTPTGVMFTTYWGFLHSSSGKHFLSSYGSFYCSGYGAVGNALVAASISTESGGEAGRYSQDTRQSLSEMQKSSQAIADAGRSQSTEPFRANRPYEPNIGYGITANVSSIGFSFRTDSQYSIDMAEGSQTTWTTESRWQQYFRANDNSGVLWEEPVVKSPDGATDTMPYPGNSTWTVDKSLQQYDNQAWSFTSGETLGNITTIATTNVAPAEGYRVNYQRS